MPYQVRIERQAISSGRVMETRITEPGPWNKVYKDKRDAYAAMVQYVVRHLGYLPDEVIVDRKGTKRVKAYIDLGQHDGRVNLRAVVVPASRARKALPRRANPLQKPVEGETALVVINQGQRAPIRFLLLNVKTGEVQGCLSVESYSSKHTEPGEIINALAIRGYGPLLYDLAAFALKQGKLAPGLFSEESERSGHADRLWSRQKSSTFWKPLSMAAFKRKYGLNPREVLKLGHEVMQTTNKTARQWVGVMDTFHMDQEEKGWSI